jgi:hypothetical protein
VEQGFDGEFSWIISWFFKLYNKWVIRFFGREILENFFVMKIYEQKSQEKYFSYFLYLNRFKIAINKINLKSTKKLVFKI